MRPNYVQQNVIENNTFFKKNNFIKAENPTGSGKGQIVYIP